MNEQDSEQTSVETNDEDSDTDQDQQLTEKPEVTGEAEGKAEEIMKSYEERPTAVLPGSGGTVAGAAINEWLDDEGNPKYGQDKADSPEGESTKDAAEDE